ncbi:MAG: hypothetical protein A3F12_04120 [Gammaproteobacteria bacterium RIFCSPHIGHO2_12_FULL_38_14]|nr:MAG: hypothetical protein A3F12_04120 [Gammaproteobacteria bacterium RIFCSPHIGHO2_12_FULL_38_14]
MKVLQCLQNQFQDYLLNSNPNFQNSIVNTKKVPAETRLAIYNNAYRSRLVDALAANYPVLQTYLGCEQFEALGQAYLSANPSSFRSIRWFGDQLVNFLNEHADYKAFPYLAELAQFEWVLTLVFDATDSPVLQMEEMGSIPPGAWVNMRLQTHPSLHRLSLSWNVVQIWQAISDDKTPPDPIENSVPIHWVVWRKDLTNHFCSLTEDEAWAIDALLNGATFSGICEGLCQWVDEGEAGLRAASLLKGWISEGLVAKVVLSCA